MKIRNRIVETRTVLARELLPNPKNWRRHPKAQADALKALLREIGIADALLVRELPDQRLMLVDGHLRADIMPDQEVTVLVLDLTEDEADKLLLTLDPLAAMATADNQSLNQLLETVRSDDPAILALLDGLRAREGLLLQELSTLADPEPQLDQADELRSKYGTASGQLWQVGPHRIVCGDSRDPQTVGRLWDAGGVNRCLPAPTPNLKLYRTPDSRDVLVTYDELREKSDSIRRRAFFLKPNVRRIEDHKRPKFISPAKVMELSLVPVAEAGSANPPDGEVIFARISGDSQEFTLMWFGTDLGPYALPVYVDRSSEFRRVLLTPLATTGDVIVVVLVVGAVAGAIVAYSYAAGRACWNP